MVPTTLGILVAIFALIHLAPGDPAMLMGGSGMEQNANVDRGARAEKFRRKHGLDRSKLVQFFDYLGPFNLDRDGHPWFTVRYTERKVERVALRGGGEAVEGVPLPIEDLPGTPQETSLFRRESAERFARGEQGPVGVTDRRELLAGGMGAVPALLTELTKVSGSEQGVERLSALLTEVTGHVPEVPAERSEAIGQEALIRHWFGWYYIHGGDRVQATGERPWGGLLLGDLRTEMQTGQPVAAELGKRLLVTVPLSLVSALLSFLIAVPLGLYSVRRRGTRRDSALTTLLYGLFAIPTFWAGLMLVLAFGATGLNWLPVLGLHSPNAAELGPAAYAWDTLLHAILPVVTLTYGSLAYLSRQTRAGLIEVAGMDYIRTARAKGVPEGQVWRRHALRNGALPVLTLMGAVLPVLIGGSIVVETVFDLPGMGLYAYKGLLARDAHILLATTLLVGVLTQLGLLFSDVAYRLADPRIGDA